MTEQELRALVRDVIARDVHGVRPQLDHEVRSVRIPTDVSHAMFTVPTGADTGGPCVIEPAVQCTHCGYCKSYGH
jgi:hypothetical protein